MALDPGGALRTRSLAVCVATFGRPAGLRTLLEGLAVQHRVPDCCWHVVVVDNDADRSAESVVVDGRARLGLEIAYAVEPRRGVAHARNTAVRMSGAVDWVAFIDDDECPAPDWLATLLATQLQFAADVVTGPVAFDFTPLRRPWIPDTRRMMTLSFPTGTRRPLATTGNTLVRRVLLGDDPFDAIHFRDVAEDTDCFLRLARDGATIVWADEARVVETVPADRQTIRSMQRRAFRAGQAWTRVERRYRLGPAVAARRATAGVGHVAFGAGLVAVGAVTARPARVADGASRLALGLGQLVGVVDGRPVPVAMRSSLPRARRIYIAEWREGGHRLAWVGAIADAALAQGATVTLLTTRKVLRSTEYRVHLTSRVSSDGLAVAVDDAMDTRLGLLRLLARVRPEGGLVLPEADKRLFALLLVGLVGRLPTPLSITVNRPVTLKWSSKAKTARALVKLGALVLLRAMRGSVDVHLLEDPLASRGERLWRWPLSAERHRLADPGDLAGSSPAAAPDDIEQTLMKPMCVALVGAIDSRKNLPLILESWATREHAPGEALLVAGRQTDDVRRWLSDQPHCADVVFVDRYLDNHELLAIVQRSRALFVLYDGNLPSGVLMLAAANGTRVIAIRGSRTGRVAHHHALALLAEPTPSSLSEATRQAFSRSDDPEPVPVPTGEDFGRRVLRAWDRPVASGQGHAPGRAGARGPTVSSRRKNTPSI